ncbi:hypothetical protein BHE90_017606, partial [Fusarium euwallaceae]
MDHMCHLCAKCFDTAEKLREHSRFLRDVNDIFAQPQPSLPHVLELLLRYTTHSTEPDSEQDLACPEPDCTYVSTESYQALQRHYMTHVEVPTHLKKCLYCSIPLRRVSLGVRHPDACNTRKRKGQPITAEVTERKRILSGLAFEKLRLAQREKRRRMQQTIEQARKIENGEGGRGIASGTGWSPTQTLGWKPILTGVDADLSVVPAATVITACGIDTERCYGNQGEDPQRALGYAPQSPNHRCSHSATALGTNTAGETDCNMLNNTAHPTQLAATFASNPTDEAAVYALPTQHANTMEGLSAYEADSLLNSSSDFLRAATLSSNTADGAAAVYLPTQHGSMTEGIPDYDTVSFLNSHSDVLRAATLGSNTADGTA